jgi:PEGA domain
VTTRAQSLALVAGAVVVVVAVVAILVSAGGAGPRKAPAGPELAKVDIVSVPAGATVTRADGGILGTTPFTLSLAKSNTELPVIVKAVGYQDRAVTVPLFADSGRIDVTLTAIGAVAPPGPAPARDGRL